METKVHVHTYTNECGVWVHYYQGPTTLFTIFSDYSTYTSVKRVSAPDYLPLPVRNFSFVTDAPYLDGAGFSLLEDSNFFEDDFSIFNRKVLGIDSKDFIFEL